jgi:hypothetical protein
MPPSLRRTRKYQPSSAVAPVTGRLCGNSGHRICANSFRVMQRCAIVARSPAADARSTARASASRLFAPPSKRCATAGAGRCPVRTAAESGSFGET